MFGLRYYGTVFDDPQNDDGPKDYEWNRTLMFIGVVASLCIVISISVIFCFVYRRLYSNWLTQAQRRPRQRLTISQGGRFSWRGADNHHFPSPREGLCRAAVDALPVFVFKRESFRNGLSCAVCLSEFEEDEKARLLPTCNHSFHIDCIDMWLCSHCTCPLCRTSVKAQSLECGPRQEEVSVIEDETDHVNAMISTSGGSSSAADQKCNNDDESSNDKITITEYIAVDIPAGEK